MKVIDNVYENTVKKEIIFEKKDLKFIVKAYQFSSDELIELDFEPEFQGDTFTGNFSTLTDALRKIEELKNSGWESIELQIRAETELVSFTFVEKLGSTICFASITIDEGKITEESSRKLAKIKEIIEGDVDIQ